MIKIRYGVFETNSSSVHSMVMCSKEEYEKLKDNELLIDKWRDKILTIEEAKEQYAKQSFKYGQERPDIYKANDEAVIHLLEDYYVASTLENYGYEYESFYDEYKTKSGETVVAFGYYGHD